VASDRARMRPIWHPAESWILTTAIGLFGMVFVVGPSVQHGRIPGDIGDARFNLYVLEHVYRWLVGKTHHFWSAPIFYPYPLAIAFSDNFLGDGTIYALARVAGMVPEDAFRLWYALGFGINFAVASLVLNRLGYSQLAAALGAFLFTFGMPVTVQEGHAQLIYRFGVPLATMALLQARGARPLLSLGMALFWTTWQFYCSIYIGYFLILFLASLVIGMGLCAEAGPVAGVCGLPMAALRIWNAQPLRAKLLFLAATATLLALLALLFMPYIMASHIYGFRRSWAEIATMLPRPVSYLYSSDSRLWPSSGALFNALPMPGEQSMFVGVAPFLAVTVRVCLRLARRIQTDRLFGPVSAALLMLVIGTLYVHGYTLYRPLAALPGADAIRAVSRIIVVMLFPMGLLVASSFDAIMRLRGSVVARTAAVAVLGTLIALEASLTSHYTSTKRDWQARMAAVAALLPPNLPPDPILLLGPAPNEPWFATQIDAMLFAQKRGWRTINGYSGNLPTGYEIPTTCQQGLSDLQHGLALLNPARDYQSVASQVLMLRYPPSCKDLARSRGPRATSLRGAKR